MCKNIKGDSMKINSINSPSFGRFECPTTKQYYEIMGGIIDFGIDYHSIGVPSRVKNSKTKHIRISPNNDVYLCNEEKGEKEFHKVVENFDKSLCSNFLEAFMQLFPETRQEIEIGIYSKPTAPDYIVSDI